MTKFQRVKLPWSRFFCDLECVFTRAGCAPGLRTQHVDNIGQSVGVTVSVKTMKIRKPVRGNRPEIEQRTGELLCAWPKLDAKACRGVVGVLYIMVVVGSIICLGFGIECFLHPDYTICTGENGTDTVGDSINYTALLIGGSLLVFSALIPPLVFFVRAGIAKKNAGELAKGAQYNIDREVGDL